LAAASFGIGTTEFVIMGLLPDVARSLSVTIPQAGYLVSGYALGVVIGAPIVAMATAGIPRKTALLALMALFTIGNLGCALAPDYWLLMTARVVTAFAHGAFFGIGAVVASNLVPREQRTQAVSLMFAGLTLANVLGVPFGTALGQAAGWRAAFWAVVAIGIIAFLAITRFVPSGMPGTRGGLAKEFRALGRWPVLLPMLISTMASVSMFSLFTYITPLLEEVTGLTPHGVTGALLAIGVGLTIGNLIGGRLADRNLLSTIIGAFICLVIVLGSAALGRAHDPSDAGAADPVGRYRLRAGLAAADLGGRCGHGRAEPRLDPEPGRVQSRQCHRRMDRRRGAECRHALCAASAARSARCHGRAWAHAEQSH
jgi:DHA1 family inner membrane transport protein